MESVRWAFNFRNWSPKKEEWMHCLSLIQQEEKDRISKFVFKKDAKASLAGRLLMRKVISEKLKIPWFNFQLHRTEKGRPFIHEASGEKLNIDFNVSHQGKWVVLAAETSGYKVGIDIVEIEKAKMKNVPEFFRLMRRQFTTEEWNIIKKYSCEKTRLKGFYRNWCLKEAFVKSLGIGISYDLQSISFTPHSELTIGAIIRDTQVTVDGHFDPSWCFEECLFDETHIVSVAFQHFNRYYKETPFKILLYEDLISNSEQILPYDDKLADDFMHKKESPAY